MSGPMTDYKLGKKRRMNMAIRMRNKLPILIIILGTLVISSVSPGAFAAPGLSDDMTYTVTNTDDAGDGSLRWAIEQANAHPGLDTIGFNIGSAPNADGMHVIALETVLPAITDPVALDGTSQPGYSTSPVVEINGEKVDKTCQGPSLGRYRDFPGLDVRSDPGSDVNASGTTIRGLKVSHFCQGISVSGEVRPDEGAAIQPSYGCLAGGARITDVTVEGNVLVHNDAGNAALDLCNAQDSTVQGNYLDNKTDNIEVAHSEYVEVTENEGVHGKDAVSLVSSHSISVIDNSFSGAERGIQMKFGAADNFIAGNHISNVMGFGLTLSDNNVVQGNTIEGSRWFGIEIRAGSNNTVEDNVLKYNGFAGVVIGAGLRRAVRRCAIDGDGTPFGCDEAWAPFRQGGAFDNTIRNNEIAFNKGPGILVGAVFNEYVDGGVPDGDGAEFVAQRNTLSGNVIYGNDGLGIDLSDETQNFYHPVGAPYEPYHVVVMAARPDGVTPNGSMMVANAGQNFPVLSSAMATPGRLVVRGIIDSPNPRTVTIEFFANSEGDPSGHGEGAAFLGAVTPDANGQFTAPLSPVPVGTLITATATDAEGNTSEFAANIEARP